MTIGEVFDDPQVRHNDMKVTLTDGVAVTGSPVRVSGVPALAPSAAPMLGADTDSVLRGLGVTEDEIRRLEAARLIVRN
jgi:formyl-CoA transferase